MRWEWLIRLAIFVPVLYLVMVVYVGQRQTTAADTLRSAVRPTVKGVLYIAILVASMAILQALFID